jgi:uncharacterized protein with ATP-grasp and redox domains
MGVKMNWRCFLCHFGKHVDTASRLGDSDTVTAFSKDLMRLYLSAPEDASLTWFGTGTNALYRKYFDLPEDRFAEEKALSNRFVLERLDAIRQRVQSAADPVYAGLQYAILGNYIDFSALYGEVSFEKFDEMLDAAGELAVDRANYARLCADLQVGKRLLYITDNAGEIGFDRVFAEALHAAYPQLDITFCVRGGPAANDALRADAEAVGIPFRVIDNGNSLVGTELTCLGEEAKTALETADVILSKGQANVESLYGSGYNIYYAFLIKCQRFMELFGKEKFTPMLVRERKDAHE